MAVTADRLQDIGEELSHWLHRKRATKRELQSLAGKLNFIAKCCKPGRLFMSRIISAMKGLQRSTHHIYLNLGFKQDVKWWINFLPHFNATNLIKDGEPSVAFNTDACMLGCGGVCGREFYSFEFPSELLDMVTCISPLEFLAVIIAVKLWAFQWRGGVHTCEM